MIVCAARLAQEKDVTVLVEAMGKVAARVPEACCVIAGDGPERQRIEEQIRLSALGGRIVLAGFREDAIAIIGAADLFVLPSRAEPFGLVLLEAMSLGKPVIAVAAGGPKQIVNDGVTGFLVPPRDSVALAGAIVDLLRDPTRRASMGEEAWLRFTREFTATAMARATTDVYEKALRNSREAKGAVREVGCGSC